jgi:hypothetical protein
MRTFDDIKNQDFRAIKIGDSFYIQKRTIFGWSYRACSLFYGEYSINWIIGTLKFFRFLGILFTIGSVIGMIGTEADKISVQFFCFSFLITFILSAIMQITKFFSYSWARECKSLQEAEDEIDKFATEKAERLKRKAQIKEDKKAKKFYYFHSERQLRLEKLKRIGK